FHRKLGREFVSDPVIYKILALVHIVLWSAFCARYLVRLVRGRFWDKESTFAYALLIMAVAMVMYGMATVLRQFLGIDYFGRDAVRITASCGLLLTGLVFHRAISKWPTDTGLRRREDDQPL